MEKIVIYIAEGVVIFMSMVFYVYLFSAIIPKFIMKLGCKVNTCDRGLKRYKYSNGRCVVYEPELSARKYVTSYALYVEDGYKYIKCSVTPNVRDLRYDVYAFDNKDRLIDIIAVSENVTKKEYTNEVGLPPDTSYVRFVLRRADAEYYSGRVIANYSAVRYILCAIIVAFATAAEAFLLYFLTKDLLVRAFAIPTTVFSSLVGMIFVTLVISLMAAGFTVLAYRRNCKKVINK